MSKIEIKKPERSELDKMGVFSWPIWEKEVSTFDWHYDERETCYILEGEVEVKPKDDDPVKFGPGDLISFPKGMDCVWEISKPVKKHYTFG